MALAEKPMLSTLHQTQVQGDDECENNTVESSTQCCSRLCFFPMSLCQSSAPAATHWRGIRSAEEGRWWPRKVEKLKAWSTEHAAGARRKVTASFRRIGCSNRKRKGLESSYDLESYALNFDLGSCNDRDWDCPAFSLRFACPSRNS